MERRSRRGGYGRNPQSTQPRQQYQYAHSGKWTWEIHFPGRERTVGPIINTGQDSIQAGRAKNINIKETIYKGIENRRNLIEPMGFPIKILYSE